MKTKHLMSAKDLFSPPGVIVARTPLLLQYAIFAILLAALGTPFGAMAVFYERCVVCDERVGGPIEDGKSSDGSAHAFHRLASSIGLGMQLHDPSLGFEEGEYYYTALRLPESSERMALGPHALRPDEEWPLFIGKPVRPLQVNKIVTARVVAHLPGHGELLALVEGHKITADLVDLLLPSDEGGSVESAVLWSKSVSANKAGGIGDNIQLRRGTGRYVFGGFTVKDGEIIYNSYYSSAAAGAFSRDLLSVRYFQIHNKKMPDELKKAIGAYLGNTHLSSMPGDAKNRKLFPRIYHSNMLAALSRTTRLPIRLEYGLISSSYTWNTSKHGPIENHLHQGTGYPTINPQLDNYLRDLEWYVDSLNNSL